LRSEDGEIAVGPGFELLHQPRRGPPDDGDLGSALALEAGKELVHHRLQSIGAEHFHRRPPTPFAPAVTGRSVDLDQHPAALDHGLVGLDWNHAGWRYHLAGPHVELPVVEVALDHLALEETFRERARPMGAVVVGDIERPVYVEHGEREVPALDLERAAGRDLGAAAKIDAGGHAGLHVDVGPAKM